MGVLPGAEPFAAGGGEIGVLLRHGLTRSPQSGPGTRCQPRDGASSTEVSEVILEDSYQVPTLDPDAPTISAGTPDFVPHTSAPAAS